MQFTWHKQHCMILWSLPVYPLCACAGFSLVFETDMHACITSASWRTKWGDRDTETPHLLVTAEAVDHTSAMETAVEGSHLQCWLNPRFAAARRSRV
jgi:hypothetical protein